MIKIEKIETMGWESAIKGMRNPMNSWNKSDSYFGKNSIWDNYCNKLCQHKDSQCDHSTVCCNAVFGENDMKLMKQLSKAGTDHRKFMRMIIVYMDITAPLYWWKEFDTYKVGTVANSCSTMHKIHDKEFTLDDFSCEHLKHEFVPAPVVSPICSLKQTIDTMNYYRSLYIQDKDKEYWWQMIQLLPSSYNQKRTVMLNYEVLANMYHSRKTHKLDEWREFCEKLKSLPHSYLITGDDLTND